MGNAISPCLQGISSQTSSVKLIFWEGITRVLTGKHVAGEIMFQHPDMMVCHADSFFIGQSIPSLAIDDELMSGQTYFVLPIDRFACGVLSTSSLAALGNATNSETGKTAVKFIGHSPFEYIKGANGRVLIKVAPEFITRLISKGNEVESNQAESPQNANSFLCTTPELQKQYDQLVGSKGQVWSPKLETISEYKIRYSPCRFVGFKVKQKEG